jgi:hypothetical protein
MGAFDVPNNITTVLSGHVSPETAYLVEDYPYGFRLRCKIRYWLEFTPKRGVRFMSQTSNPKKPGEPWNKPKASTYCRFAGAMYLDDQKHVQWSGMHEYMELDECEKWMQVFSAGIPDACKNLADGWMKAKRHYEAVKAEKRAQGDENWPFKPIE